MACEGTSDMASGPSDGMPKSGFEGGTISTALDAASSSELGAALAPDAVPTPDSPELPATTEPPATTDAGPLTAAAVVVFGGNISINGPLSDATSEWNGTTWTDLTPNVGPSARAGAAMAPLGDKVVLFGGYDGVGLLSDTWEWDGTAWTQLLISGPPARMGHLMAAFQGTVVLFGGSTNGDGSASALSDTWSFDGTTWTMQAGSAPYANGWGMASVPASASGCTGECLGARLVLFGAGPSENGTMMWDGTAWSLIDVAASNTNTYPPPGFGVLAGVGESIVLSQTPVAVTGTTTTWQWSAGAWTQAQVTGTTPPLTALYAYQLQAGYQVPTLGMSPPLDELTSAIASFGDGAILLSASGGAPTSTWVWSNGGWSQSSTSTSPSGVVGEALAPRFAP